jgi:hypothetical protein
VQRRVSPWPDNAFVAELSAWTHARTLPEAMVQAQLPDALLVERAPRPAPLLGATFVRQGARSILAVLDGSRAVMAWLDSVFPAAA